MNKSVSETIKKKLNKKIIAAVSAVAAVLIVLAIVLPIVLGANPEKPFAVPENRLPTEEKYALKKYDYDDLDEVQTTLRADVLNVTKRDLPRQTPQILEDIFTLVYNTDTKTLGAAYGQYNASSVERVSQITFTQYPAPNHTISSAMFQNEAAAASVTEAQYFTYYKYMLMTQGQHLAHESARRSRSSYRAFGDSTPRTAEDSLTGWLKKHPAADAQYGAVKGENNAVEKVITLDPLYRGYHAAGLYLPAGEVVTVKVEGLAAGERISINIGEQNTLAWRGSVPGAALTEVNNETGGINTVTFKDSTSDNFFKQADMVTVLGKFYDYNSTSTPFLQSQWNRQNSRTPWLSASFTFDKNGEYEIGFPFGGVMHIAPNNCYSAVKTTITGAVETPHYILGVTTPEYFDEYLKDAPGVVAVLDTENGQLIGPTGEMGTKGYMRGVKKDEIDKLAMLWHSFFSVNESFTGGVYNRYNKVMFDWHVPAGAAVALGGHTYACPTSWFGNAMSYRGLLSYGQWGILHEVGHNHGSVYGSIWGFATGREGEVRNNALTLLSYIMFCDVGTTIRMGGTAEHGGYANPYSVLTETLKFKDKGEDFNDGTYGYFQCLGMYANIMHSFGAEKYYELLYTYKSVPSYASNKRADFAYRCSLIYGMNFIKYFNTFYSANITETMFTEEQLAMMNGLPDYQPVTNFYAGTIDGVKTSGDYIVTFGDDLIFDLKGKTISTLDDGDNKGFEIISVEKPAHGNIEKQEDGTWKYSFDKTYIGVFDEFSFSVKLKDGVIHRFTVTLRINYNGGELGFYDELPSTAWDAAEEHIKTAEPQVSSLAHSYIPSYNSGRIKQARVLKYYWKAPVSGEVSLSAQSDDGIRLYFGKDFEDMELLLQLDTYNTGYSDEKSAKVTVEKDKMYAVKILNVNAGGPGSASVAYKNEDGTYVIIPDSQVFNPSLPLDRELPVYVFEPQFMVSKKDNIKISNSGTDKSEWSVVEAPDGNRVSDGRFIIEHMTDEETGEVTEFKTDKWDWLVDGQTNTIFHTAWKGAGVKAPTPESPDVFIFDTAREQTFNYFTITTRLTHNDDARITKYRLSISSDGVNYKTVSAALPENTDDILSYVNTNGTKVAQLKFNGVQGRYWKLEVMATSGRNFTIISELDAGIISNTQRVVPSTTKQFFTTGGWKNSSELEDEPSGYMIADKANEKMVVRFRGESFAMYAAVGSGYGSADVYLDGRKYETFSTASEHPELRKLVLNIENLEDKEHTVEIITNSAAKLMVNVIGIPYTASLVNAPNIYLERALTISLVVFVLLFVAVAAFIAVLVFVPKFRTMVFGNKLMQKLDNREKKPKREKPSKPAAKKSAESESRTDRVNAALAELRTSKKTENKAAEPAAAPVKQKTAEKTVVKATVKTPETKTTAAKSTVKQAEKKEAKPAAKSVNKESEAKAAKTPAKPADGKTNSGKK